jgi:hypothetical protein
LSDLVATKKQVWFDSCSALDTRACNLNEKILINYTWYVFLEKKIYFILFLFYINTNNCERSIALKTRQRTSKRCHNSLCHACLGHQNSLYTYKFMVVTTIFVHTIFCHQNSPYIHKFMVVTTTFIHTHLNHQNNIYTHKFIVVTTVFVHIIFSHQNNSYIQIHGCHNNLYLCIFMPSK